MIVAGGTNSTLIPGVTLTAAGVLIDGVDTIAITAAKEGVAKTLSELLDSFTRSGGLVDGDVCLAKRCRAKLRDLDEHRAWRNASAVANKTSSCAHEGCPERMRHQCSRCRLMFCGEHVAERRIPDRDVHPTDRVGAAVCDHCAGRRRVWE